MGGTPGKEAKREMKQTWPIVGRFLTTKLAPAVSMGGEILTGEDYERQPTTAMGVLVKSVTSLNLRDIYEAMRETGVPEGTALSLLATFGLGLQYQEPKKAKKKQPSKRSRGKKWYR